MIEDEQQYQSIKEELAKYEQALAALRSRQAVEPPNLLRRKILEDALYSMVNELEGQVQEYEGLRDGRMQVLKLTSLAELPHALFLANVAIGKGPEKESWLVEQYAAVRLRQLPAVAESLGVGIHIELTMPVPSEPVEGAQERDDS